MPEFLLSAGIPSYPSGLTDKETSLVLPLYKAINALAQQLSIVSGNAQYSQGEMAEVSQLTKLSAGKINKVFVKAAEAINYGQLMTLTVVSGKIVAYVATATNLARPAHAVCDKVGGIPVGGYGEAIFMQGLTAGISGSIFGSAYYLSTAGAVQITPPTATGVLNQLVGIGMGSAGFYLNAETIGRRVAYSYMYSAAVLRILYTDGTYGDLAV